MLAEGRQTRAGEQLYMKDLCSSHWPIVFIHQRDPRHVPKALIHARASNPHSSIHLIGDSFNSGLVGVENHDLNQYSYSANQLAATYRHLSSNSSEYELFCIQRWLYLNEFMAKNHLDRCVYLDSDVMVYSDLSQAALELGEFDMTTSQSSPHCNLVASKTVLDSFCRFILESYSKPIRYFGLPEFYHNLQRQGSPGGVCDMTFFWLFMRNPEFKVRDLSEMAGPNAFDHSLNQSNGFQMHNGIKKLRWINGRPHGFHLESSQWRRFHTLHFQGATKKYMAANLQLNSISARAQYTRNWIHSEFQRCRYKMSPRPVSIQERNALPGVVRV